MVGGVERANALTCCMARMWRSEDSFLSEHSTFTPGPADQAARTSACWVISVAPQQGHCIIDLVLLELERGWRKTFMACILNTGLRSCCLFDEEKKDPWPDTLPKGNLFFVHFCTLNGTKGEEELSCAPIWPFHLSPDTPEILVIQMAPKCH